MITSLLRTAQSWRATRRREPFATEAANPDNRRSSMSPPRQDRSCVIIVENLPVPFDRRVWQEAQALSRAGWTVSVICPANPDFPKRFEVIDDIAIYRHPLPLEGRGALAYFGEYSAAMFHQLRLLIKVHRERGFSIIQACNPPDLIFLPVVPFKLMGKRFIFDQHDVSPELFIVKFGNKGLPLSGAHVFRADELRHGGPRHHRQRDLQGHRRQSRRQGAFAGRGRLWGAGSQAHPSRRA